MALPEHLEENIVVGMFDRGLLGFPEGGIKLKSGRQSPYYYNMRGILSFSADLLQSCQMNLLRQRTFRGLLVQGYAAKFSDIQAPYDHVFGKAQAGTAVAAVAAYEAGRSYIWERVPEPNKTYGHHKDIEGDIQPGERVLMADDVVTDGKSKEEGVLVLAAAGLTAVASTLQFDRQEGGVQFMEEQLGLEVNSITTISSAARILLANNRIDNGHIETLNVYHDGLRDAGLVTTYDL